MGEVAYKLELPKESRIHNVFHVSCLEKALGQHITTAVELPPLDDEGHLVLTLEIILETKEKKLRNSVIREYLVKWKNLPGEDSTWESEQILQHPVLQLLGDKQYSGEEDCNVFPKGRRKSIFGNFVIFGYKQICWRT